MKDDNPIKQLSLADIQAGWAHYDNAQTELAAFIQQVPAARLAHDAAVTAMNAGDAAGRSTWEGFLRALYIVARKLDQ